ncbi:MAG: hypothetical protein WA946_05490 [Nitrospirota bacterium]
MKTVRFAALIIIPFLFSCLPKKPEIPMTEVPAGPVLEALEQRRQSFTGLKAIASVEVVKRGRKRTLENVGVVLDAQRRFRIEAYGPLGQSELVLVWDGREVLERLPGNDRVVRQGAAGLERLLGEGVGVQDLCALLSGNIPAGDQPPDARLFCGRDNECILELSRGDVVRRVKVVFPAGPGRVPSMVSQELFLSGKLVYQAKFNRTTEIAHYPLPMNIVISNPGNNLLLSLVYSDVEVNIPISDEAFLLNDADSGAEIK